MSPRPEDALSDALDAEIERKGGAPSHDELRPLDVRLVAHAKRGTRVVVALTGLATALGTGVGVVVKAVRSWRAGPTPPAALPAATGVPTTAPDFVPKPAPAAPPSRGGEKS